MPKVNQAKNKGRFAGIPNAVMENRSYLALSFSARSLLLEFAKQYNGHNNGKLCAIPEQLAPRGFRSATTVYNATKELLSSELIILSKLGPKGSRKPHYYALAWQPIDFISTFEMDIAPTKRAVRSFLLENQSIKAV